MEGGEPTDTSDFFFEGKEKFHSVRIYKKIYET